MATENDSTTEDTAVDKAAIKKSPIQLIDDIQDRLRWAIGVLNVFESADDVDNHVSEALYGIEAHLRRATKISQKLARRLPRPAMPRDLNNRSQREDEKRDLVRRMLKLSHDEVNQVTFCHIFIASADDPAEGLRLLDKYPLSYVHHFMSVQKNEAKEKPQEDGAP